MIAATAAYSWGWALSETNPMIGSSGIGTIACMRINSESTTAQALKAVPPNETTWNPLFSRLSTYL